MAQGTCANVLLVEMLRHAEELVDARISTRLLTSPYIQDHLSRLSASVEVLFYAAQLQSY